MFDTFWISKIYKMGLIFLVFHLHASACLNTKGFFSFRVWDIVIYTLHILSAAVGLVNCTQFSSNYSFFHWTHLFHRVFHWSKHHWIFPFDLMWSCAVLFLLLSFMSPNFTFEMKFQFKLLVAQNLVLYVLDRITYLPYVNKRMVESILFIISQTEWASLYVYGCLKWVPGRWHSCHAHHVWLSSSLRWSSPRL